MSHTLVTILGGRRPIGGNQKSDEGTGGRYEETVYRFPDESEYQTPFLGLALSRHLKPHTIVILGTCSSQWGVLVEHLSEGDNDEDARLRLFDAEDNGAVTQALSKTAYRKTRSTASRMPRSTNVPPTYGMPCRR